MKTNVLKVSTGLIFLIIFNVLFFLLKGENSSTAVWGSYVFIHLAYLLMLATPMLFKSGKGYAILKESLYLQGFYFFVAELVVGIFFMLVNPQNPAWALVPQGIMLAAFIVFQLMGVMANDATKQSMEKQKKESFQMRILTEQVREHMLTINDVDLKKQVMQCYEALNNSSIESFPEIQDAENTLRESVNQLCVAIEEGDSNHISTAANKVQSAVRSRNTALRIYRQQ